MISSDVQVGRSNSALAALDAMQAALRSLSAERDPYRLCAQATREAAAFFGAAQCAVLLRDDASGRFCAQEPAVGLDAAASTALSAIPPEHIERVLAQCPEHGVMRLLDEPYLALADPKLMQKLQEKEVLLALMRAESRVIGVLRLANKLDGSLFSEQEVHVLGFYASQLGLMIHSRQLLVEEQRARRLAETLLKVPQVVRNPAAGDDIRAVLTRLLTLLQEVTDCSSASVTLVQQREMRILAGWGKQATLDLIGYSWDPAGDEKLAAILATNQPLSIPDTHLDGRWLEFAGLEGVRSWIGAPIWAPGTAQHTKGDLIGILNVDGERPDAFGPGDLAVARAFADQMAIVMENQRLYTAQAALAGERAGLLEEVERHLQRAERHSQELAMVNRISSHLSASLDIGAVLRSTVTELAQALRVEQSGLVLFDWNAGYGQLVAEYQRYPDSTGRDTRIPVDGNLSLARVLESRAPLVIRRAQEDPLLANVREIMVRRGVKSILLVPLIVRGAVIGTVGLDELEEERDFSPTEIELAQTITNQAAAAVANAQLYGEVQDRARALADALNELKALDRMKDEFMQTISHELRTPLTFLKGYVELLLEGTLGELSPDQRDALQTVAARTDSVVRLVNDIISLTRRDPAELSLQPIDLQQVAHAAIDGAEAVSVQEGIELRLDAEPGLPPVLGDAQRLIQVFDNLLSNAIKFSPDGGSTVWVRLRAEGQVVRAEVVDHGIGIPPDQQNRVWDRFYQVDGTTTRRYSGSGLGLAIVKRLVEAHGGRVGVDSAPGQGSTFYFTLPRADSRVSG